MRTKYKQYNDMPSHTQNGNAMVYVLIALALFGVLTATLSSQNDQADDDNLTQEIAELYANDLIEYAASAQSVIDQMQITGSGISDFDFILPSDGNFNVGSNIHKVYHPAGGGLNYKGADYDDAYWEAATERGWQHMTEQNVAWTASASTDILYSFMDLNETICENINDTLTGSTTIPTLVLGGKNLNDLFNESISGAAGTGTAIDFTETECAACDGIPSLCVTDGTDYVFYNIFAAR